MVNIYEILLRAASLKEETTLNSISPERAGGIMYDTLLALNDLWLQQGAALVISKIYASVAAMQADTAPVSDLTGQPLRPGQIVVIASSDSDNGSVYRYNGTDAPSWSLVGAIGSIPPVDSLDSDSTTLPLAAHQGKVLDGKISQLGQEISQLKQDVGLKIVANTDNYDRYDCSLKAGRYFVRCINASQSSSVGIFFYTAEDVELSVFVQAPAGGSAESYIDLPVDCAYIKTSFIGTVAEILYLGSMIGELVDRNSESIKKLAGIKITANTNNYDRYDCSLKAGRYFVRCINASQSSSVGIFFYTAEDVELSVFVQAPAGGSAESYIDLPVDCAYIKTSFIGTIAEILYLDSAIGDMVASLMNPIELGLTTIVVKSGGTIGTDCDFTDIDSAIASISGNNKNNRYIVYVKNGVYDITGIN